MLIRNVKSKHDLENRKKLQAELLQVQIDNEALSEQRVKDYKNPNKPPPVPPQYKSNSEMQKDGLIQQKEAIDNLRTLNLDFAIASQVSQDLTKLPDGIGNLVKLNKNFPFIKEDITKKLNPKYLDAQTIIEYLKEYFAELDSSIGINLSGSSSTNYFNSSPMSGALILPSQEALLLLRNDVDTVFNKYPLNPKDVETILDQLDGLAAISPTDDDLKEIDAFPVIERQRLNKTVERLIKVYKIPTSSFIYDIAKKIDVIEKATPAQSSLSADPQQPPSQELQYALASLKNTLAQIDTKAQQRLLEFKRAIEEEQGKIKKAQDELINIPPPPPPPLPAHATNPNINRKSIIADNIEYIQKKTNNLNPTQSRIRLTNPTVAAIFNGYYINQVPTIDGNPPQRDGSNVIFEVKDGVGLLDPIDINGNEVDVFGMGIDLYRYLLVARKTGKKNIFNSPDNAKEIDSRYTKEKLREIIRDNEHPIIFKRLEDDDDFDPKHNKSDRVIDDLQGFGITNKVIKHFEKDNKEMMKLKKSYNKHLKTEKKADDESSSDEEKMGKGKMAFKGRRIKLGKGIAIQKDEPTYREFGKYVIHYPHLVNNNLLNVKYPSLGSIPAIKIVNVDDNFKDFMIDVLENGRVNQRHYNNLTEPEKTHFVKVARGAGLLSVLGISSNGDDQECKDIKRLELLFGEINAGNDNDKMIKECKTLIKKYVANGRINKNKGLEMLMELD
jgi:hypothetical protein